jgi:diadenosine tetraphosphate (Ap4A) HIT family hydrolase
MNSDEKLTGDINCLFARDEYQGSTGNRLHIHAIARVNYDANDPHVVDAF